MTSVGCYFLIHFLLFSSFPLSSSFPFLVHFYDVGAEFFREFDHCGRDWLAITHIDICDFVGEGIQLFSGDGFPEYVGVGLRIRFLASRYPGRSKRGSVGDHYHG